MPRRTLERHLQLVKADLAAGRESANRQRHIVADLLRRGEDATVARARLREAEETLAIYVAEASRLDIELAALT
jgi:hypothetical protein